MSLDVYLYERGARRGSADRIYIRENGQNREITRAEWDARFPGREPVVVSSSDGDCVYEANITHNLNAMAKAAGIYTPIWRPEEIGVTHARQLINPLRTGLALLMREPDRFKVHNPENGWGTYDGLVVFVANYLAACEKYPNAEVSASR